MLRLEKHATTLLYYPSYLWLLQAMWVCSVFYLFFLHFLLPLSCLVFLFLPLSLKLLALPFLLFHCPITGSSLYLTS